MYFWFIKTEYLLLFFNVIFLFSEMPSRKRPRLSRHSQKAANSRANESEKAHASRLADLRRREVLCRANENEEQTRLRRETLRLNSAASRANENEEQGKLRRQGLRSRADDNRANETEEQHSLRLSQMRMAVTTRCVRINTLKREAFDYKPDAE